MLDNPEETFMIKTNEPKNITSDDMFNVYLKGDEKTSYDFMLSLLTEVFGQKEYTATCILDAESSPEGVFAGRFNKAKALKQTAEAELRAKNAKFHLVCKVVKTPEFKKSDFLMQNNAIDYRDFRIEEDAAVLFESASRTAEKNKYAYLTPETLLLELLKFKLPYRVFEDSGKNTEKKLEKALKDYVSSNMTLLSSDSSEKTVESKEYTAILQDAARYADYLNQRSKNKENGISMFALLIAFYEGDSFASQMIRELVPDYNLFNYNMAVCLDGRETSELISKRS